MGEITVPRQILYAVVNKGGWILASTTRSRRSDVIAEMMRIERKYYPNDPSAESWAKLRKRWGYRIIRFEVEGPAYVS
ncbi:hypothetical protein [Brevundimonas olei]|uniref:hypothetical protein n=1 Tax=Brevundimonas olei TaxID=657642 RepID=UPI0031D2B199